MRIRTIKPEFFEDEGLAALSPHERLLFIGTWMLADCNGVLEHRPAFIQAKIFPYERGETSDVSQMLPRLVAGGYLLRYEVDGREYLMVRNFAKHQRITGKEADSDGRFPLPCNGLNEKKQRGNNGETPGKHPDAQEQGAGNRANAAPATADIFDPEALPERDAAALARGMTHAKPDPPKPIPRGLPDLRAMHPVHVGRDERSDWDALVSTWGWEPLDEGCRELAKAKPGQRIFLSELTAWVTTHFKLEPTK